MINSICSLYMMLKSSSLAKGQTLGGYLARPIYIQGTFLAKTAMR